MTVNVAPEMSEILGWLEYKTRHDGFSRERIERDLGWELGPYLEGDEPINVEHLLQVLKVMRLDPCEFVLEAFNYKPSRPKASYETDLREELVRLLNEHIDAFSDRPRLPTIDRPRFADAHMIDHLILKERTELAINSTNDLVAATRWMLARLEPADRRMLTGLCERVGTFEAAIKVIPDLLAIVETSIEAVWAMAHQRQLMKTPWRRTDLLVDEVNAEAVAFLLDLEIKAGRRDDQAEMVKLREKLQAIGGDDV